MENCRHIIPISGKDSLCTAIVQLKYDSVAEYEFLYNPTGSELPEVFEWLNRVESYFDIEIVKIGNNLLDIIEGKNFFLPSRLRRYCTMDAKIRPMLEYINGDDCEIYFGIRADENRKGFNNMWSKNISCNYPLIRHGIRINDVYRIISSIGLKPPVFFWNRLYLDVKKRLGFDPKQYLSEWMFDKLFSWRSRANCFHCFNQRQYEIAGLWEHYPHLAEKALWYESQGTSKKSYTWREKPFDWYRDNLDFIFKKRSNELVKRIQATRQLSLFQEEENAFVNMFSLSCGLLCGK